MASDGSAVRHRRLASKLEAATSEAGSHRSHEYSKNGHIGRNSSGAHGHMSTPAWASSLPPNAVDVSILEVVPAFAALLPRHDLHSAPDCTHFCFTPFLWEPVWHAAADAMLAVQHKHRANGKERERD